MATPSRRRLLNQCAQSTWAWVVRQDRSEGDADFEACDDGNRATDDACSTPAPTRGAVTGVAQRPHRGQQALSRDDERRPDRRCLPGRSVRCGDGVVYAGEEQCDDGNAVDDDACSNACVANLLPSRVVEGTLIHDYWALPRRTLTG